jgi:hypothetical protein
MEETEVWSLQFHPQVPARLFAGIAGGVFAADMAGGAWLRRSEPTGSAIDTLLSPTAPGEVPIEPKMVDRDTVPA